MKFSQMNKYVYNLLQWTWGLPQTIAGAAVFACHRRDRKYDYKGSKVTVWSKAEGLSLGKFIFVPEDADLFLLDHEYGHTIQSLILGPLYLLVVGAPSIVWNKHPYFRSLRKKRGMSYYSAPFESTASSLGARHRGKDRRKGNDSML